MIQINKPEDCCGCSACASRCPVQCITMTADSEGFLYPHVDVDKCIGCGLCDSVCPVLNRYNSGQQMPPRAYVVQHKDSEQLMSCTSGGAVTALSKWVIDQGGYVCGAEFDKNFRVHHVITNTWEICERFRGSKYVQSDVENCFPRIKALLEAGEMVLFVGTGCQVRGLKLYLSKNYDKLYLIDLVCHGVPSPAVWLQYLKTMENRVGSKVVFVNFRDKALGYQTPSMKLIFKNGKTYRATARTDLMLRAFFRHLSIRPSCFQCSCKGVERCSDMTVFDCWNVEKIVGPEDNKGYTVVLAQTDKGADLFEKTKNGNKAITVTLDAVIPVGGGKVINSAKPHKSRALFYQIISESGLHAAMDAVDKITAVDLLIEKIKQGLAGTKFLKQLSRSRRVVRKKIEFRRFS